MKFSMMLLVAGAWMLLDANSAIAKDAPPIDATNLPSKGKVDPRQDISPAGIEAGYSSDGKFVSYSSKNANLIQIVPEGVLVGVTVTILKQEANEWICLVFASNKNFCRMIAITFASGKTLKFPLTPAGMVQEAPPFIQPIVWNTKTGPEDSHYFRSAFILRKEDYLKYFVQDTPKTMSFSLKELRDGKLVTTSLYSDLENSFRDMAKYFCQVNSCEELLLSVAGNELPSSIRPLRANDVQKESFAAKSKKRGEASLGIQGAPEEKEFPEGSLALAPFYGIGNGTMVDWEWSRSEFQKNELAYSTFQKKYYTQVGKMLQRKDSPLLYSAHFSLSGKLSKFEVLFKDDIYRKDRFDVLDNRFAAVITSCEIFYRNKGLVLANRSYSMKYASDSYFLRKIIVANDQLIVMVERCAVPGSGNHVILSAYSPRDYSVETLTKDFQFLE